MKQVSFRTAFTLIEVLVAIAIMGVLIGLLLPAVQRVREASARLGCANNLKQIGLAVHGYHDAMGYYPPGYIDGNTDPNSTPDNDVGPGWGWASFILPYLQQTGVYDQINFKVGVGSGSNKAVSQIALTVYQCPSDGIQQAFPVYDSTFKKQGVTLAHANYIGCNGWMECFIGAGGNPQPEDGGDASAGGSGVKGVGIFYRNSRNNSSDVKDGLSNTIFVGERSSNHSPSTWTGAVAGGRCPAWMSTRPLAIYAPPPGPAYDNADFGEAFVLGHGDVDHVPNADEPGYDPDTFYSSHPHGANFLFGDGSVHFLSTTISGITYQNLMTIAGGEASNDW